MTRQYSTGRLRDTPCVANDLTDSSTGHVRETIVLPNYETDSSTVYKRQLLHGLYYNMFDRSSDGESDLHVPHLILSHCSSGGESLTGPVMESV